MDKELICLDTSVLIDYYRKKDKSKTKFVQLSEQYSFAVSVIVKFEILTGINANQEEYWVKLFDNLKVLPLGEKDVEIAATILRSLIKQNRIIGLKDILISATAITNNLPISTLNINEFQRIENLKLVY